MYGNSMAGCLTVCGFGLVCALRRPFLRQALVGCAGRGAGARGTDCGPVVRAGEGGQGDDLLAAVCRVPALGGDIYY
jgi:hypothetical protein